MMMVLSPSHKVMYAAVEGTVERLFASSEIDWLSGLKKR
jgi:hypothetical protein